MGSPIHTAVLVGVATILLIIMAILIIIAGNRIHNITGFSTNTRLTNTRTKLIWAQVMAWVAAGLSLLLVIGYIFLSTGHLASEWLHIILFILTFAALITSGVFLFLILRDIHNTTITDNNGSPSYVWGALITGAIAFLVLLIAAGIRLFYRPDVEVAAVETTAYVPLPPPPPVRRTVCREVIDGVPEDIPLDPIIPPVLPAVAAPVVHSHQGPRTTSVTTRTPDGSEMTKTVVEKPCNCAALEAPVVAPRTMVPITVRREVPVVRAPTVRSVPAVVPAAVPVTTVVEGDVDI